MQMCTLPEANRIWPSSHHEDSSLMPVLLTVAALPMGQDVEASETRHRPWVAHPQVAPCPLDLH
eukprot:3462077-Pyramimonas_sp.AAC.1